MIIYIIVGIICFVSGYILCGRLSQGERADVSVLKDALLFKSIEIKELRNRLEER
jgi:hypothetical protein